MPRLRRLGLKATTKAALTSLTTRTRARAANPAAGLSEDNDELDRQIALYSDKIYDYLKVARAIDGSRSLGVEVVEEKIIIPKYINSLYLTRGPILFDAGTALPLIGTVVLNDDVLLSTDVEVVGSGSKIAIKANSVDLQPFAGELVIEYTAGWNLPADNTDNNNANALPLPGEIEEALFTLLRGDVSERQRDPSIRSEESDEVDAFTYVVEGASAVSWKRAKALLDPHVRRFTR